MEYESIVEFQTIYLIVLLLTNNINGISNGWTWTFQTIFRVFNVFNSIRLH